MFTAGEVWMGGAEGAALGGALVGGLGAWYGLGHRSHQVLVVGSLVLLFATWVFSIAQRGALGGVLALLVSAAVLFWISTRIRAVPEPGDR
jgi:hypothetical protein